MATRYGLQETILLRLEASRKELLDLGLRNPLLHYKTPKSRGLQVIREKPAPVYNMLVLQGRALSFAGRNLKNNDTENQLTLLPAEQELEAGYVDTKLQTSEPEEKLQSRLLNTYYVARTGIEEQGVNILYISLGKLKWYEEGNKNDRRMAPLVLVPVSLERSSAQERFRIRYTGGEIGANLSLQAKMLTDFNIAIPDIIEADEFNISKYFNDIDDQVHHLAGWKVEADEIELGFFFFGKFMIYHDLDSFEWPEENKPFEHPLLQNLFGNGFSEAAPGFTEDHQLDTETNADDLFQVLDADSSQVLAMPSLYMKAGTW